MLVLVLSGCSTLGYYYQSARGQLDLMAKAQDIDTLLADDATPAPLKSRLRRAQAMRRFASERLALPDNDSYRRFARLERDYVVWNVFAAPELSVEPQQWCFPIVGCVAYRGYFDEADARRQARRLHKQGLDTFVAGVPAYSTLGWFDDPLPSSVIDYPETRLAALIFHELAHQVAYAKDDTVFNESFATSVEIEGVERWLVHRGRAQDIAAYRLRRRRDARVVALILAYRQQLARAYQSDRDEHWKRARKTAIIKALRRRYHELVAGWDGYQGYARWFGQELNNAHFAVIAAYHDKLGAFQRLLACHDGDLALFYQAVAALADAAPAARDRALRVLESESAEPAPSTDTHQPEVCHDHFHTAAKGAGTARLGAPVPRLRGVLPGADG